MRESANTIVLYFVIAVHPSWAPRVLAVQHKCFEGLGPTVSSPTRLNIVNDKLCTQELGTWHIRQQRALSILCVLGVFPVGVLRPADTGDRHEAFAPFSN